MTAVYRLAAEADGRFRSAVFTIPEPLRFAGDWRFGDPLDGLEPEDLEPREGCAVVLRRADEATFAGATEGTGCSSTLRGAAYATSEVRVSAGSATASRAGTAASTPRASRSGVRSRGPTGSAAARPGR